MNQKNGEASLFFFLSSCILSLIIWCYVAATRFGFPKPYLKDLYDALPFAL
jgi:hypothetical protein